MKRISLQGRLDEDMAERVVAEMRAAADRPIDLRINSEGGVFAAAIQICLEIEEQHDRPIFTTVVGEAASAAAIVALAGDQRRIAFDGTLMLHYGRPASRERALELREIVSAYSSWPESDVAGWLAREKTFSAREAINCGLVDRIIDASAPEPVRLREPAKRRPTTWLRRWRELLERCDARVDALAVR